MPTSVTVQIVTYNSRDELGECLESVGRQTVAPERILVLDNGSGDGTATLARELGAEVFALGENLGYGKAHNRGFRMLESDFVLVLNPDVRLEPDYLEILLKEMEANSRAGMAGGLLLGDSPAGPVIDSAGLVLPRNRRAYDRGRGEPDTGGYAVTERVFGICGAAVLYRTEFLRDIAEAGAVFDEDFFMYKEDVDLSWRALRRGWEAIFAGRARAYHKRGWQSRRELSREIRIHSLKNRYLTLLKNETPRGFFLNLPWILATEAGIWGYVLFREPFLFKVLPRVLRLTPRMLQKRRFFRFDRRMTTSAGNLGREAIA